jgi:predicted enzyme related to lactoylglutathione lyase
VRTFVLLHSGAETQAACAPSSLGARRSGSLNEGIIAMDWKLEVVVIPVTDIDRAKSFYVDQLGFHLDADMKPTETMRVVQMTPPGSACSVTIGPNLIRADAVRGSGASLQLVVHDIEAARAQLVERGVEVTRVQRLDPRDGGKFAFFSDPDGNNWAVQEIREHVGATLE